MNITRVQDCPNVFLYHMASFPRRLVEVEFVHFNISVSFRNARYGPRRANAHSPAFMWSTDRALGRYFVKPGTSIPNKDSKGTRRVKDSQRFSSYLVPSARKRDPAELCADILYAPGTTPEGATTSKIASFLLPLHLNKESLGFGAWDAAQFIDVTAGEITTHPVLSSCLYPLTLAITFR
ncbi:uncharacterized protein BT62DRAFT_1004318 [Guyanagaster necrorhizus]|uniref:Uncharacterized protein n=1 Tax=Guyanagaster necrorhizus TaxID=856835 RepID=A0A9P7VVD5_9AGAR|nr:uncharacterized protein BT62DRAFT_1004318 [Guyanagaster necrorhizus MCA 3950]KAG7447557.1 hypothetical protein BT62DRAFT_1004318 [Guyanagaster necrorhizus MCA 3950]